MNSPCIHIILPVHNRKEITSQFIACLKNQTYSNFHLIVIDDGSTDGTSDMVKRLFPDATIITGKGNWWWGGSLQQGYLWLKQRRDLLDDFVLIINDDTIIENDFLQKGLDFLINRQKTLLLAQAYGQKTNALVDKGVVIDYSTFTFRMAETANEINCMSTRGLFLRVKDMLNIGGFRSRLLPHYYSDYEFTIRAGKKGYKLTTSESLKLWMNEESTGIGKIDKQSPSEYLKTWFEKKHTDHPFYTLNFILLTFPYPYNFKFSYLLGRHVLSLLYMLVIKREVPG